MLAHLVVEEGSPRGVVPPLPRPINPINKFSGLNNRVSPSALRRKLVNVTPGNGFVVISKSSNIILHSLSSGNIMATLFCEPVVANDLAKSNAKLTLALATSYAETSSISNTLAGNGGNSISSKLYPSLIALFVAETDARCNSKNDDGGGVLSAEALTSSGVDPPSIVGAGMFIYSGDIAVHCCCFCCFDTEFVLVVCEGAKAWTGERPQTSTAKVAAILLLTIV